MSVLSLTYTLTAGTPENVNHVQQNFTDISTWAAGNIGGSNMTALDPVPYSKIAVVDAARVYNSANISIPTGTATPLTFDSERYDTNGLHSTSSNTQRLTCKTTGIHQVGACVAFAASGSTYEATISLRVNGNNSLIIGQNWRAGLVSGKPITMPVVATYSLTAADFVEVVVSQTSGSALNVTTFPTYSPEFWMTYLGRIT